jgi:hypothetical protein
MVVEGVVEGKRGLWDMGCRVMGPVGQTGTKKPDGCNGRGREGYQENAGKGRPRGA